MYDGLADLEIPEFTLVWLGLSQSATSGMFCSVESLIQDIEIKRQESGLRKIDKSWMVLGKHWTWSLGGLYKPHLFKLRQSG
jgi:hypothetical protein